MVGGIDSTDQSARCICITGMHRTGTSVVAELLQRHGLWLGDEAELMSADPYNPDGYFENTRLVEVNDAILAAFGGSWKSPPDLPATWIDDPRIADMLNAARASEERLDRDRPWGFKDPRTAITLPFWRSVWGDVTVIVTLRNPLETAHSLNRRDEIPLHQGMELWSGYYHALVQNTTPGTRIVVEYEGLCGDPVGSAGALLSRLPRLREMDPRLARDSVRLPLRHYRATLADLQAQGAPIEVVELYNQLRGEAVNAAAEVAADGGNEQILAAISGLDLAIRNVHFDLQRLTAIVTRLAGEVGHMRSADLTAIASLIENQRSGELPRLASAVERIEADLGANGRQG